MVRRKARRGQRGTPLEISAAIHLYSKTRHRATSRGKTWEMPFVTFCVLIFRDCIYCDSPPKNRYSPQGSRGGKERGVCFYQGLDRLDSRKGYTEANAVPCCEECNRIKSNLLSPAEMLDVIKIMKHHRK